MTIEAFAQTFTATQPTHLVVPIYDGKSITSKRLAITSFIHGLYGKPAPRHYLYRLAKALDVSFDTVQSYLSRERASGLIDYTFCERTGRYLNLRIKTAVIGNLYVTLDNLRATGGNWLKAAYLNAVQYGMANGFTAKQVLQRLKTFLHRNTLCNLRSYIKTTFTDLYEYVAARNCTKQSMTPDKNCTKQSTIKNNKQTLYGDLNKPTAKAAAQAVEKACDSRYLSKSDRAAYDALFKLFKSVGCTSKQSKRMTKIIRRGDGKRWGFRYNGYATSLDLATVLSEFVECVSHDSCLAVHLRLLEGRVIKHQRINKSVFG